MTWQIEWASRFTYEMVRLLVTAMDFFEHVENLWQNTIMLLAML
jgi:hypothetical protein